LRACPTGRPECARRTVPAPRDRQAAAAAGASRPRFPYGKVNCSLLVIGIVACAASAGTALARLVYRSFRCYSSGCQRRVPCSRRKVPEVGALCSQVRALYSRCRVPVAEAPCSRADSRIPAQRLENTRRSPRAEKSIRAEVCGACYPPWFGYWTLDLCDEGLQPTLVKLHCHTDRESAHMAEIVRQNLLCRLGSSRRE